MRKKRLKKGFTFIELMFAIALFGVNFHLIYGQVSSSIRSIARLKKRQRLYYQVQNHIQFELMSPYELTTSSTISLSKGLNGFIAKQVVEVLEFGLKKVKVDVIEKRTSINILSLVFLKSESIRKKSL
ncbi:MAG: hypothetical protein COB02_03630 [Candidatus Cloacimonadota bacterium]|nr:MAG: hypothetical protein COB02_03630 [Candidatus Cloacimonadota bacterium]